jgi:hypothetical protein
MGEMGDLFMTKVIEKHTNSLLQNNLVHTKISFAYNIFIEWRYYIEQVRQKYVRTKYQFKETVSAA